MRRREENTRGVGCGLKRGNEERRRMVNVA